MNSSSILQITVYASLIIQILTGVGNIWILQFNTPDDANLIRELVYSELAVQIIEVIFYFWLAYNLLSVKNITPKRYYDWIFTTPTMLITLIAYFIYLRYKNENKCTSNIGLLDIISKEWYNILIICLLNALMLIIGYLGEIGTLALTHSVLLGSIMFIAYFYLIYKNYVKDVEGTSEIFYTFAILWSLYGVAATLPYDWKNISYNILDLFSKNFFGVFLTYVLYSEYISKA